MAHVSLEQTSLEPKPEFEGGHLDSESIAHNRPFLAVIVGDLLKIRGPKGRAGDVFRDS